jgi:hypothetical protein
MSGAKAWKLIEEADALRAQGAREEKWSPLIEPIKQRVKKAVGLAPKDSTILFMATWLLTPFAAVDAEAKQLVSDYQRRLDQQGEPSDDVLGLVGGKAAYERHRATVNKAVGSSGCSIVVTTLLALFASAGLLVLRLK